MIIGGGITTIPGLPEGAQQKLIGVFNSQPRLQEVWLYGSRAMGRERPASDVDLCLTGETLGHGDLLRLMASVDDLLLPWQVDMALRHQLPDDLLEHINRVGRCIWRQA
jgi:predicted nucleotidyltransferase